MNPYSFILLRYVHDIGSGEFANVGLILWSPRSPRLRVKISDRYSRLSKFFADFDGLSYRRVIKHVDDRFRQKADELEQLDFLQPLPKDLLTLVHSVLPHDDTALQWSAVMSGVAENLDARAEELFEELILRHEISLARERRDEHAMKKDVDRVLLDAGLRGRVRHGVDVVGVDYEYTFHVGWSNGSLQVLEPISLDFINPADMVEKANTWSGRLYNLARTVEFSCTAVVAPPTEVSHPRQLARALSILRNARAVRSVLLEADMAQVVEVIRRDLGST